MAFSLGDLRDYLFDKFGILPDQVQWDTDFRVDLHLTNNEIRAIVCTASAWADIQAPIETARNLTNVFDLMIYVLLHSPGTDDVEVHFNALFNPARQLAPDEFRPFGVALLHQLNLN